MPEIIKDARRWHVSLVFPKDECPYLFFPRNIHGCKLKKVIKLDDDDKCNKDTCPHLINID